MTKAPSIPEQAPPPNDEQADADLFDYAAIKAWLGFTWRAIGRHRTVAVVAFVGVAGLAFFLAWVLPKKYEATSTLLANRDDLVAQLGNPHRVQSFDMDGPTRAAQEQVLARKSLEALIKTTNLIDHWEANRHPVLKLKDKIFHSVFGEPPPEQKLDNMVGTLEKRLQVFSGNGTITITIYWPHAQMARTLVETAQQNFLETKFAGESNAIGDAISLLEQRMGEAQASIDEAIENVQRITEERSRPKDKPAPARPAAPKPTPQAEVATAQELSQLKFLIRNKRQSISDLEDMRQRRLTELQSQLAEQKVIFSDSHPVVLDIRERIEALQKQSPQVAQLKRDEQSLIDEYRSRGGKDVNASNEPGTQVRRVEPLGDLLFRDVAPDLRDDPAISTARDQLRMATARYQDFLMRVDAAKMELSNVRREFRDPSKPGGRYMVVRPAQTPRNPISPNVMLIVLGGLFGGVAFAFFASAAIDVWRGKLVEPWQIEKRLKVPLLADIRPTK